jgi:hypothetical protein
MLKIITIFIFSNNLLAQYSMSSNPTYKKYYYASESNKYFDTLDTYASRDSKPKYSSHVIRWEWYPWLFLTAHRRWSLRLDRLLLLYPTKVINRDCRGFDIQPFGRCHVTFHYLKGDHLVDIYEEFTFNDQGEITFIEAWTDEPGLAPMEEWDYWAQDLSVNRLSTKVPGLGSYGGKYNKKEIKRLAKTDKDLKNLLKRLRFPVSLWLFEAVRFAFKRH